MRFVIAALLVCSVACATKPPADGDGSVRGVAAASIGTLQTVAPPAEELPTHATFESQDARVNELQALEARVAGTASQLPTTGTQVFDPLGGPRTVIGVPRQEAQRWVIDAENEVRRLLASQEWAGLEVAEFVRNQLDQRVHESHMPSEVGLVPAPAIQQYVQTFRDILQHAQTDPAFRVTFNVQTLPTGATFVLCREYAPTDCKKVGTYARFDQIYRGKYIYTITMGGYHTVSAIPLDLVHFGQSLLKCPLRKVTDVLGPVPCSPQ
jgi:hypothetical protein